MARRRKAKPPKAVEDDTTAQNRKDDHMVAAKNSTSSGNKLASHELPIDEKFAKRYEESKRRQFLSNAAAVALDETDESSSSSEEEDEFGELLTKRIDRKVNQTLDAIRKKDPRIYDRQVKFFEDVGDQSGDRSSGSDTDDKSDDEPVAGWDTIAKAAEQDTQKLTLKDYVRESLLHDGRLSDDDDDEDEEDGHAKVKRESSIEPNDELGGTDDGLNGMAISSSGRQNAHPRAQDHILDSTGKEDRLDGFGNSSNDDGESDGENFFTKKEKTPAQLEEEARALESFMKKRSVATSKQAGEDLLLHSYLEKETPDEKERFLRDFVLNNGWLDKNASEAPGAHDYEIEIDTNHGGEGEEELEEENGFDEKADNFEAQYNFRFEDPEATQIVSHTRNIPDSMRRQDTRRKRAREARKLRKEREKAEKAEEIKHLKNMKKKEIQARLMAIQEAAGDGVDLNGLDLEGDFDPDAFNKQMESKFNDEYYSKDDEHVGHAEGDHPTFKAESERVDKQAETIPDDVKADVRRMTDAYYNLDFEDIVGGVPMRFNYKKVEAESFSMTAEEILNADDKELNRMVSLKYLAPYISNRDVQKQAWKARARRRRRGSEQVPDQDGNFTASKASHDDQNDFQLSEATANRSAKRQRRRSNSAKHRSNVQNTKEALDDSDPTQNISGGQSPGDVNGDTISHDQDSLRPKKKRKRKRKSEGLCDQEPMAESRKKAYGLGS